VTRATLVCAAGAAALGAGAAAAALSLATRNPEPTAPGTSSSSSLTAGSAPPPPFVMFRTLAPRDAHGHVAMVPARDPGSPRYVTSLVCERVVYASGTGLCLLEESKDATVKNVAYIFDKTFTKRQRIELAGVPIRARLSPDGKLATVTTYAEEESPAGERLASESILIDAASGQVLADLREFAVVNERFPAIDGPIDIASVAFEADSDRFYATLSTPAHRYLVSGSVRRRLLEVVGDGVANEAVSPDGRRLAVKKRVGDRSYWQVMVLDLATMTGHPLNQGPGSVDDQIEWLDDNHLVYHDATDQGTAIWKLSTDGSTGPQLLIGHAFSPTVQR